jgi:hypothetical protein
MDDVCVLTRDEGDVDDIESGTVNPATFQLTGTTQPTQIYPVPGDTSDGAGRCKISTVGPAYKVEEQGGALLQEDKFWFSMPLSYLRLHPQCEPAAGDTVVITDSRRDASFVGTKFVVERVIRKTLQASRRCVVVEATDTEADL